jgi:plasmid stability protein
MASAMKATFNINDTVMAELRREAARQGRTMSEMAESALRVMLRPKRRRQAPLLPLPTFSAEMLVDIDNRDALYEAIEGR